MPKRNTMDDLRDHIFEALERLKDAEPEELEAEVKRSRAVADLSSRLVDTAKVEVEYHRVAGQALEPPRRSRLLTAASEGSGDEP